VVGVWVGPRKRNTVQNARIGHELDRVGEHNTGAVERPTLRVRAGKIDHPSTIPPFFATLVRRLIRDHGPPSVTSHYPTSRLRFKPHEPVPRLALRPRFAEHLRDAPAAPGV